MLRTIYVAGVNTRKLASAADTVPFWLLSVTLLKTRKGLPEWIRPYLINRTILWDPGTFTEECISYHGYRAFLDRWARSKDEYLQYDEVGDPEATEWYWRDMVRRGYKPIPVLQPGATARLLEEPRVAIGGTVPMSREARKQYLDWLFYQSGVKVLGRVHLLGMWRSEWFERYLSTSGDSTTWIPRGPYNRTRTMEEWLSEYGEQNIPYREPRILQQTLAGV